MSRLRVLRATIIAAIVLPASESTAQGMRDSIVTPQGACRVWILPPGGSSFAADASRARCAVDRAPALLPGQAMPPAPRRAPYAGGRFVVVVNGDGSVDPARTLPLLLAGSDTMANRSILEGIRAWRFSAPEHQGAPVRTAFLLDVVTDMRNDTVPSRLVWEYRTAWAGDSLVGRWMTSEGAPAVLTEAQVDSTYAAVFRELSRMQVVSPSSRVPRCLVIGDGDSAIHRRLSTLAGRMLRAETHQLGFLAPGCERSPEALRLVVPRLHRTEGGRVVLYPQGDHLPNYPRGEEGTSWRAWTGRCVADVDATSSASVECDVSPLPTPGEREQARTRLAALRSGAPPRTDSLLMTVTVSMREAFQVDTIRRMIPMPPRLSERALRSASAPCGGRAAFSTRGADSLRVVVGNAGGSMGILDVRPEPPPAAPTSPRCSPSEEPITDLTAFFLGDVGRPVTAPVTLCFSQCAFRYELDPARHTLAERAVARFKLSDLRPESRVGRQLALRVRADPAPDDLLVLVVYHTGDPALARVQLARRARLDLWDFGVIQAGGYPQATEVSIYLVRR